MPDQTRIPPGGSAPLANRFGAAGLLVVVAAAISAAGCSLAVNLDALGGALGPDVDAAPSDSTVAIEAGESSDSTVGGGDSADPSEGAREDADSDDGTRQFPDAGGQEAAMDAADSDLSENALNDWSVGNADAEADADADGSAPEAGIDADGGADASEAGTWCEAHWSANTIDCHDFDEGRPAPSGFTSHYYSGRYASVTSADFAPGSPPSALVLATPLLAAGAQPSEEQFNDVLAFHNKVDLSFALKIANYDPTAGYLSLFRVSYQNGAWAAEFDFHQSGANITESTALADGGTRRSTYVAAQPSALDAWTDVDCLFDLAKHTVSLSFDGVAIVSNQIITNPEQSSPTIFVQTGLNFLQGPAKPMMIFYDDIVLSTPP